jgi:uncharacterized protein (TIGR02266 family)
MVGAAPSNELGADIASASAATLSIAPVASVRSVPTPVNLKLQQLEAELEQARKLLSERAQEVEGLRAELRQVEAERQSLHEELAVKTSEVSRLSEELASLRPLSLAARSASQPLIAEMPVIPGSPRAARFSSGSMAAVIPPTVISAAPDVLELKGGVDSEPPMDVLDDFWQDPISDQDHIPTLAAPPGDSVAILTEQALAQRALPSLPATKQDYPSLPAANDYPSLRAGNADLESQANTSDYPSLRAVYFSKAAEQLSGSTEVPAGDDAAPTSERRNDGRRACEFAVEFEHQTHFFAGLSQDISTGGLFIATYCTLPVGTVLRLRFELPDGTEIVAGGRVCWLRETDTSEARPGMGIELTELSPQALQKITIFCETRPPMLFDA